jgi:hypothetical protein
MTGDVIEKNTAGAHPESHELTSATVITRGALS